MKNLSLLKFFIVVLSLMCVACSLTNDLTKYTFADQTFCSDFFLPNNFFIAATSCAFVSSTQL